MARVKVKHAKLVQGAGTCWIDEADFDPAVHTKVEEGSSAPTPVKKEEEKEEKPSFAAAKKPFGKKTE